MSDALTIVTAEDRPVDVATYTAVAAVMLPLITQHVLDVDGVRLPLVLKYQKAGAWLYAYVDETHGLRVPLRSEVLTNLVRQRATAKDHAYLQRQVVDLAANLRSRDRKNIRLFRPATRGIETFKK